MPLSEQENRCVEHACEFLSSTLGGHWSIESYLDELNPAEPTPEVVVTNDNTTAAIEVKQLLGDTIDREYHESLLSNQNYLMPSCGGYYMLGPPIDLRLPMDRNLRRQVKKEIERVAPSLNPGTSGALRLPREGHISLISESGPPHISCLHTYGSLHELFQPVEERINGKFMLIDEGLEHHFVTDEAKAAFRDILTAACERCLDGDTSTFKWNEEWQITRTKDAEDEELRDGVWIIATTKARSVIDSQAECVDSVITNALGKFEKRWADFHIIVLENSMHPDSHIEQVVTQVVSDLEPDELQTVNYILLINNGMITQCHPHKA